MQAKIFIHAVNVHQGGGRNLLAGLIDAIERDGRQYVLTLDERMQISLTGSANIVIRRIKPSMIARLISEVWLFRAARNGDRVLCFGNLPPLFPLKAFTSVFVQNRCLIDRVRLVDFPIWVRARIIVERWWLRQMQTHANEFLVQTPSMQSLMSTLCRGKVPVVMHPFSVSEVTAKKVEHRPSDFTPDGFIYVASGEPHKNHRQLIEAWCLLAEEGIYPVLAITVDNNEFPELCAWIDERVKMHKLALKNLGNLNFEEMSAVYAKSQALIYPSTAESFGLPLIEAQQAGIPILACELDYVRDVVDPVETFNPESATSIAKAVKRFMGKGQIALVIKTPSSFLRHILGG